MTDKPITTKSQMINKIAELHEALVHKTQECDKAEQNAQDTFELYQALMESFNILQGEKIKLEQECERLRFPMPDTNYAILTKEEFEQLDKLKGLIKKYEECNKYLVEENGKTYTRLEYKLLRTLIEIKEIAKQCFGKEFCTSCKYCEQCYVENGKISTYDVCKIILQKIRECEVENE